MRWCRSYRFPGVRFDWAVRAEEFFVAYNFAYFAGDFSPYKTEISGF